MLEIISFMGVVGGGKNHKARQLAESGYLHIDFKDALLDMCSDLVGYDVREDYNWFKTHVVGIKRPSNRLLEAFCHTDTHDLVARFPHMMIGRRLLQRLGTEVMRKRDKDYWADRFIVAVKDAADKGEKDVVNSDCRFLNEVEAIKSIGARHRFVFCDFRSDRYDDSFDHESEMLAQALLKIGMKNGEEIQGRHFDEVREYLADARKYQAGTKEKP